MWAIAALISPYRDDRERARQTVGASRFIEVYLATPLTVCEARDPKGLYRRAQAGDIAHFTGISDAYAAPLHPDLQLDTAAQSLAQCVAATTELLDAGSAGPLRTDLREAASCSPGSSATITGTEVGR